MLSDAMPGSGSSEQLNPGSHHSSGGKKKGWKSRIFGGGKSTKKNKISTTMSKPEGAGKVPAKRLLASASSDSQNQNLTQQQHHQRRQYQQQQSLRKATSRESAHSRSTLASGQEAKTTGPSSPQIAGSNGAPTSIIRNNKKTPQRSNESRPVPEDPALELLASGSSSPGAAAARSIAALPRNSEITKLLERPFGRAFQ